MISFKKKLLVYSCTPVERLFDSWSTYYSLYYFEWYLDRSAQFDRSNIFNDRQYFKRSRSREWTWQKNIATVKVVCLLTVIKKNCFTKIHFHFFVRSTSIHDDQSSRQKQLEIRKLHIRIRDQIIYVSQYQVSNVLSLSDWCHYNRCSINDRMRCDRDV